MNTTRLTFNIKALHHEIAGIAYVTADVLLQADNHHALHQTFDICEDENALRIDRLLNLAFSEAAHALAPILLTFRPFRAGGEGCASFTFATGTVSSPVLLRIKETVREFLICRALHGWLSVTLPGSAQKWNDRAQLLLAALRALPSGRHTVTRRPSPF